MGKNFTQAFAAFLSGDMNQACNFRNARARWEILFFSDVSISAKLHIGISEIRLQIKTRASANEEAWHVDVRLAFKFENRVPSYKFVSSLAGNERWGPIHTKHTRSTGGHDLPLWRGESIQLRRSIRGELRVTNRTAALKQDRGVTWTFRIAKGAYCLSRFVFIRCKQIVQSLVTNSPQEPFSVALSASRPRIHTWSPACIGERGLNTCRDQGDLQEPYSKEKCPQQAQGHSP